MPSKKKKYNARFPAGRIKKIMQTDEEVGKVAQAVPVIISKALEMFIESLLKKSMHITQSRNAKTLTPSHMKQCILSESRFDFLKDLVKNIPDASVQEDNENNALAESNANFGVIPDEPGTPVEALIQPREKRKEYVAAAAAHLEQEQNSSKADSATRTPVIQFGPNVSRQDSSAYNFSDTIISSNDSTHIENKEPKLHVTVQELTNTETMVNHKGSKSQQLEVQALIPVSSSTYGHNSTSDNLCIDEDYDN